MGIEIVRVMKEGDRLINGVNLMAYPHIQAVVKLSVFDRQVAFGVGYSRPKSRPYLMFNGWSRRTAEWFERRPAIKV